MATRSEPEGEADVVGGLLQVDGGAVHLNVPGLLLPPPTAGRGGTGGVSLNLVGVKF